MSRKIELNHVAKVEGHVSLHVEVDKGKVNKIEMQCVEGARFFEGFLVGRSFYEAPVLTQRICGVCPQSHNLASIQAMEDILGVKVTVQTKVFREVLMYAQIIQSHVLHMFFLTAADYLDVAGVPEMAKKYPNLVKLAIKLKKNANMVKEVISGRAVHSISPVIGGFTKLPSQDEIDSIVKEFKANRKYAIKAADVLLGLDYPDFSRPRESFAVCNGKNYEALNGEVYGDCGTRFGKSVYSDEFVEVVKRYSAAKFVSHKKKSFMVGALARVNNNFDNLEDGVKKLSAKHKLSFPSSNPFMNNAAQALEIVQYWDMIIKALDGFAVKDEGIVEFEVRAGIGIGAIEVPRGTLYHEYEINSKGEIVSANIIAPTTQNIMCMEDDAKEYIPMLLGSDKGEMIRKIEMLIRAYDPCLSCSAHYVERK